MLLHTLAGFGAPTYFSMPQKARLVDKGRAGLCATLIMYFSKAPLGLIWLS